MTFSYPLGPTESMQGKVAICGLPHGLSALLSLLFFARLATAKAVDPTRFQISDQHLFDLSSAEHVILPRVESEHRIRELDMQPRDGENAESESNRPRPSTVNSAGNLTRYAVLPTATVASTYPAAPRAPPFLLSQT